jgi:large subunit ribosomal protein L32
MLPVQRQTRSQSGQRRSHRKAIVRRAVRCPNCGNAKLPHAACSECGYVRPGLTIKLSKDE